MTAPAGSEDAGLVLSAEERDGLLAALEGAVLAQEFDGPLGMDPADAAYAILDTRHSMPAAPSPAEEVARIVAARVRDTRLDIAAELDSLAQGRMEYVGAEPKDGEAIRALPGMLAVVYGEATGARWLARILRGEEGARNGWLPSWRWDK